ncbi:MAG: hypothetical protein ABIJ91_03015 [Candidatus Kuenenbacteria bacterium]
MQKTYCDKCKKRAKNDSSNTIIWGDREIFGKTTFSIHLCEKCTLKFAKIVKRFFASK